jgi:hypothetical protein
MSKNGEDAGLCVARDIAELMKQQNLDISCTNTAAILEELEEDEKNDVFSGGPFSELKCTVEGRTDESKCSASATADGQPCSYCSMSKNGEDAGLCVNPEVADQMMQVNHDVSCSNIEFVRVNFDKNSFKCTIEAINDANKCSSTRTDGQESCEYCSIDGPFGSQGICVSPEHADSLKGLLGDNITCISRTGFTFNQPLSSRPITDCNFGGADHETCIDPSKVNGSECVWCDAGIGGFCFPKSWEETASRFLSCGSNSILALE